MRVTALLVAKAPVPGQVKTRLAADLGDGGDTLAASLASAALLDTIDACRAAFRRRRIALAGDLAPAVQGDAIRAALHGWQVTTQRGAGFGTRLAHAHARTGGPVLQLGMDTPQVTATLLRKTAAFLERHDAALGPAEDGGWWVLALRDPRAARVLATVPMSTPQTYDATRSALERLGLRVAEAARLRDVDHLADVEPVAASAPRSRFARRASALLEPIR